jgi:L-2,4-diaminobutyrate decarboxylase
MLNSADLRMLDPTKPAQEHEIEDSPFLFNHENLRSFELAVLQGSRLIAESISKARGPSTGAEVQRLAEVFKKINLDTPCDNLDEALEELQKVYLNDAIYFHHPKYVAHLNCPILYPAILAELILSSINTSVDTWDQSVGGTLIEQSIIDWTTSQIGFTKEADGVFTSGGTQSNLMALLLARDHFATRKLNHDIKLYGLPENYSKFRIFTSEVSHFSVQKSAAILGLGHNSIIPVSVDENIRIDPIQLEQQIKEAIDQDLHPIAVIATAGTTDFGSIDPLQEIAEICAKYDVWMHTDAAYGCGLLTTKDYRHRLTGIENSDSVTVDYHKSFFQPVSCGAFLVKDKQDLAPATHHAEYLNPLCDKNAGIPNLVNKSLQTTRRFDALKMWLTLRVIGKDALGSFFEKAMSNAQVGYRMIMAEKDLEIIHRTEISTLIFRFKPANYSDEVLDTVNQSIRLKIYKSGEAMVASTKFRGVRYLKMTLLNPDTKPEDLFEIITMVKKIGWECLASTKAGASRQ